MQHKLHGIFSLLLIVLAVTAALTTLWRLSPWLGLVYLAICGVSACGILYAYCAKCSARLDNCSHVYPGKITRFLPQRNQGSYSVGDVAGTALFLGLIFLFPQYWLLHHVVALVLFWALLIAAVAEILVFVCSRCQNELCLMCPKRQMPEDGAPEP